MNPEPEPVQSYFNVTTKSHSNSFSNPSRIYYSTRTTAHERKESELHIRPMGLCQSQKSLRHEAKQTLQYSEEREISCKPQGTIPRRSQGCWEKKDSVSRFIHELNFIILKGHWPHLDLVLPTNRRKKCYSGVRMRKSWEEGVLQKQHPTYWAKWGAMKGPACLLAASVS